MPGARLRRKAPAIAAAGLAMAGALWASRLALGTDPGAGEAERAALPVPAGLAVFVAAAWIVGALRPAGIGRAWRERS